MKRIGLQIFHRPGKSFPPQKHYSEICKKEQYGTAQSEKKTWTKKHLHFRNLANEFAKVLVLLCRKSTQREVWQVWTSYLYPSARNKRIIFFDFQHQITPLPHATMPINFLNLEAHQPYFKGKSTVELFLWCFSGSQRGRGASPIWGSAIINMAFWV